MVDFLKFKFIPLSIKVVSFVSDVLYAFNIGIIYGFLPPFKNKKSTEINMHSHKRKQATNVSQKWIGQGSPRPSDRISK